MEQFNFERSYRFYVTDCLKMISENTSKMAGGTSPKNRFADAFIKPVQETRTSDEIIDDIKSKLKKLEG